MHGASLVRVPFAALIATDGDRHVPPAALPSDRPSDQLRRRCVASISRPDGLFAAVPAAIDWFAAFRGPAVWMAGAAAFALCLVLRWRGSRRSPTAAPLANGRCDCASDASEVVAARPHSCGVGQTRLSRGCSASASRASVARRHRRPAGRRSHQAISPDSVTSNVATTSGRPRGRVQTLFWPHPVVWWIGAHCHERERLRRKRAAGAANRARGGIRPADTLGRRRPAWRVTGANLEAMEHIMAYPFGRMNGGRVARRGRWRGGSRRTGVVGIASGAGARRSSPPPIGVVRGRVGQPAPPPRSDTEPGCPATAG